MAKNKKKDVAAKGERSDDLFVDLAKEAKEAGKDVKKKTKSFWSDFKKFAAKGNIIDLAVAVVIGSAFNKIVTNLVSCIITPITGLLIPSGDLSTQKWILSEAVEANAELGIDAVAEVSVKYGLFLQSIIDFLVIALSIFVFLKIFMRVKTAVTNKENEEAAAKKKEEEAKKKAEADAELARQMELKREFLNDVAVQADVLVEIRDLLKDMNPSKAAEK